VPGGWTCSPRGLGTHVWRPRGTDWRRALAAGLVAAVFATVAAGGWAPHEAAAAAGQTGPARPLAAVELGGPAPPYTHPSPAQPPALTADAAILMDWRTGQVLYTKNAYERRPPASTTKILTAVVVLESADLSEKVTISRNAAWTPGSFMPLREGQVLTVGELLWGILLRSANNGCVALAEHIAGSERAFVELMNRRAVELGAVNTHFVNSNGLHHPAHYTTACDLAIIARYALTLPAFETLVRTRETTLYTDGTDGEMALRNTNSLLWTFAGADGVKTGTTNQAGKCLVASATRGGRRLLSVVLHSDDRYRDSDRLLAWGFENFTTVLLARRGSTLATVRVAGGLDGCVDLVPEEDFWVACPLRTSESLQFDLHVTEPLRAPVRRGQIVGVAEALVGDRTVRAVNLVAASHVPTWRVERFLLELFRPLIEFMALLGVG